MVTIKQCFIENGKKVVVLDADTGLITEILEEALKMAKERKDGDEFRMKINKHELIFHHETSYQEMVTMYQDLLTGRIYTQLRKGEKISGTLYRHLEFEVMPFDNWIWEIEEKLKALEFQMDNMALLTGDVEWAKEIHRKQIYLRKELFKRKNSQ